MNRPVKTSFIKCGKNCLMFYNSLKLNNCLYDFQYVFLLKNNNIVELNLSNFNVDTLIEYIYENVITSEEDLIELVMYNNLDSIDEETYELNKDDGIFYLVDGGGVLSV